MLLTVVYAGLTLWMRLRHRSKLVHEYVAKKPDQTKQEYIAQGMLKYNKTLRAKLAFLVYLIPLALTSLLLYLAQG
jgi:hypothetical protein